MLNWTAYPFIRITTAWIIGIIIGAKWSMGGNGVLLAIFSLFVVFLLFMMNLAKSRFYEWYAFNGIVFIVLLILAGAYRSSTYDQSCHADHLSKFYDVEWYSGIVSEPVQETVKFHKVKISINKIKCHGQWKKASGKVLVYFPKEIYLNYGDELIIRGMPAQIPPASNPWEFDYQRFMKHQNIFYQHFIRSHDQYVVGVENKGNPLFGGILKLREYAASLLKTHIRGKQEQAVALALILGIKDELDNDMKNAYGVAGAMHVLAVSGLHVGIVYGFLFLIFSQLRKGKLGRVIFMAINLSALWMYAMLTGFSPSALRATIMISAIVISQTFNRQNSIYNSIFFSAFIILLFDPFMIFALGFQLSFVAVLGIVYLTPKIYRAFYFKYRLIDKVWLLTSVSLAAQIATLPITVFNFNQFPMYFWAVNIVVIPAAFVILVSGIVLLCMGSWLWLGSWIGTLVEMVILGMNKAVFTVEKLPGSAVFPLTINQGQVLLLYLFLVTLMAFFHFKKFNYLVLTSIFLCFFAIIDWKRSLDVAQQKKIVFYSIPGYAAIDFVEGRKSHLYADSGLHVNKDVLKYSVLPFHIAHSLDCNDFAVLKLAEKDVQDKFDIIVFKGKTLVYIKKDLEGFAPENRIEADYLIVGNNAVKNLKTMVDKFNVGQIIVDGANAPWVVASLSRQSQEMKLKFISLLEEGSMVINL